MTSVVISSVVWYGGLNTWSCRAPASVLLWRNGSAEMECIGSKSNTENVTVRVV